MDLMVLLPFSTDALHLSLEDPFLKEKICFLQVKKGAHCDNETKINGHKRAFRNCTLP